MVQPVNMTRGTTPNCTTPNVATPSVATVELNARDDDPTGPSRQVPLELGIDPSVIVVARADPASVRETVDQDCADDDLVDLAAVAERRDVVTYSPSAIAVPTDCDPTDASRGVGPE